MIRPLSINTARNMSTKRIAKTATIDTTIHNVNQHISKASAIGLFEVHFVMDNDKIDTIIHVYSEEGYTVSYKPSYKDSSIITIRWAEDIIR